MIMISGTLQAMLYDWMIVITCDITSDPKWSFGRTTRDAQQHQHDARLGGAKRGNGRNWWRFGMFRWDMMIFRRKNIGMNETLQLYMVWPAEIFDAFIRFAICSESSATTFPYVPVSVSVSFPFAATGYNASESLRPPRSPVRLPGA